MSSLKADFDELRERIRHGRELGHASFEPIYYLIFDPADIIELKRHTPAWTAKLGNEGWDVRVFSIAEEIEKILANDPRRPLWLMAQKKAPHDWEKTNQALANALISNGALQQRLEEALSAMEGNKNGLVLVTDLEALHPLHQSPSGPPARCQGQVSADSGIEPFSGCRCHARPCQ